ncbi:hypothetical protein LAZ67_4002808 [Cordylochernes scorpioides]|uniref:Uncharacterized protein n=1 Tax=Cordylochernes scorpioides TaxID=51811 RepID=A0ABY6KDA9_9ARAC|nr:hypothetical protein LAZ67_4002808 [Cordylochernes scorpioides]
MPDASILRIGAGFARGPCKPPPRCKLHVRAVSIHGHLDADSSPFERMPTNSPSTLLTPRFLYYGIQPQYIEHDTETHTPIEKARKLTNERTIKSHEHSKQLYDIKHPEPIFKEGDQVLVKTFIYPNTEESTGKDLAGKQIPHIPEYEEKRSNTTMIGQTHNQVPQDSTTYSTVAASLRALTLCLDQLLNRNPEELITYDGDEPAAHFSQN